MLSDAKRVNSNLNEHTYEGLVARNSAAWSARDRAGAPASAAVGSPTGAMSNEPPAPAPAQVPTGAGPLPAATPTPTPPRPSPPRPAGARTQAGRAAAQPVQLPPSPASAGSPSRAQ
jgi:hypothetical protein